MSRVITASEKAPYLAFFLKLDISTVRDILNAGEVHIPEATSGACGMATGETMVVLVNSCSRVMDLLDAPRDISFFSKLIQREIIYRLLQGGQEHAFARLPRRRPSATGRRRRLPGSVPTTRSLCV